ncbi:hypothetical protein BMS3Bbin15_01917 [archaeon BMS3Bbin15]|nr:hypothetical protein BMS3Bbin15_01917 [archaeon BMS3Bbin15]
MKVTTFVLLALFGFFIVSSTIYYFSQISVKYSEASNSETLKSIAAKVAGLVIIADETSREINYSGEPPVNITFYLPEKVGTENYRVKIDGSRINAVSSNGLSSASTSLPYGVTSSGVIDSRDNSHFIAVNSSGYIIYR